MKKLLLSVIALFACSVVVSAQEFEIRNYDVKATVNQAAYTVEVQAKLRLINLNGKELLDKILLSSTDKPRLSFFLNPKAKVTAMKINGNTVTSTASPDRYLPLQKIYTDITSSYASQPEFDVEMSYSVPSPDRSSTLHISATEGFALPNNFWIPVVHTPYIDHGADTAPFTLTVTSPFGKVVSAGNRKDENTFEQTLAGQPFFFYGDYDVIASTAAKNSKVEVYVPKGINENGKQQAQKLADEATKIVSFYTEYFDMPQTGPFRIVTTSTRNLSLSESGAVAIDDSYFRRNILDLGTIELIAGAAARSFIDGRVLLRGRGAGMMRDGLPVYLAAQYLGSRFGDAQREAAFERFRRAYEPIARGTDTAILQLSSYDRSYTSVMFSKGALIWRLLEKRMGKQAFDTLIKKMLERQRVDILSLVEWKSPLCRMARCSNVKGDLLTVAGERKTEFQDLVGQWIENIIVPDFAVGQPQNVATGVESTVANFGSGDLSVDVVATTETGEKIQRSLIVKGGEYPSVNFPAGTKIAKIEVDPEKIYPQKDYSNDVFPRRPSPNEMFGQARLALNKNDFATAEAKAREALSLDKDSLTLQSFLGRVLVAAGKIDEAEKLLKATLNASAIPLQAYANAELGLGDINFQRKSFPEALKNYSYAAAAELDLTVVVLKELSQSITIQARDAAIKAERAAGTNSIPDEVKTFIKQLDDALLQGSSDAVGPLVEQSNLREFVKRVTTNKPSVWSTEILRAEAWDTDHIAVDANVHVKVLGKEGSGRAIYVLSRTDKKLRLSEVLVFDVK